MKFKKTSPAGAPFTEYTSTCGRWSIEQMDQTGAGKSYAIFRDGSWTGKGAALLSVAKKIAEQLAKETR